MKIMNIQLNENGQQIIKLKEDSLEFNAIRSKITKEEVEELGQLISKEFGIKLDGIEVRMERNIGIVKLNIPDVETKILPINWDSQFTFRYVPLERLH
jgi:hypothetical protein